MPKIGSLLVKENRITQQQLDQALDRQKKDGGGVAEILVEMGAITEQEVLEALGRQLGVKWVDLEGLKLDDETVNLIPADVAQKFSVVAIKKEGRFLHVATSDPSNQFMLGLLKMVTRCDIVPTITSQKAIKEVHSKLYVSKESYSDVVEETLPEDQLDWEAGGEEEEADIEMGVDEAPLVRLVNSLLMDAVRRRASDIHIEPFERTLRVRYRIEGNLIEQQPLPIRMKNAISSRLKIMSNLDIAERRVPQDGKIKLKLPEKSVDLRVSTLPVVWGEKICMRILDQENLQLDLTKLGFGEKALKDFMDGIQKPFGVVLVTGPTGSGKTTTLYSGLSLLNTPDVNISTAEDPVEYNLPGINQTLVRNEIGMTFAAALKAFLRQDPNIIMVGEIRDMETGDIAMKAALTGHLVLSTIHTNDTASTISRLISMGVADYQIASAVNVILAQRLLRKLCSQCKEPMEVTNEVCDQVGVEPSFFEGATPHKKKGCDVCNSRGYKGRTGLYEVMPMSREIRSMVLAHASTRELQEQAMKEGMLTLRADALDKFKRGVVDLHEVVRETMTDV